MVLRSDGAEGAVVGASRELAVPEGPQSLSRRCCPRFITYNSLTSVLPHWVGFPSILTHSSATSDSGGWKWCARRRGGIADDGYRVVRSYRGRGRHMARLDR